MYLRWITELDYPYHQPQYLREQSRYCFLDDRKPKDPLNAVQSVYCNSCGEKVTSSSENQEKGSGCADPGMRKNVDTDSVVYQGVLHNPIDYVNENSVTEGVGYGLRS